MRKHHFNEDYFDTIETPSQAYWLGFIATDGNVQNTAKNKCLSIGLALKDVHHLEKFAADIGYDAEVRRTSKSCSLTLYSKKIVNDLNDIGIGPRKTFTVKPWNGPSHLMKDYWRGAFDGDGSISCFRKKRKTKNDYTSWNMTFCGNREMVDGFVAYILEYGEPPYNKSIVRRNKSIWQAAYGGIRPCQTVMDVIYSDAEIYLDRKEEKFRSLMNAQLQLPVIRHITKETLLPLYEQFNNWSKVAKHLGVSHDGMYKHIRRLGLPRSGRSTKLAS